MDRLDLSWGKKKKRNWITTGTLIPFTHGPARTPTPKFMKVLGHLLSLPQCWGVEVSLLVLSRQGGSFGRLCPARQEPADVAAWLQPAGWPLALRGQKAHCSPLAKLSPSYSVDLFISKKSQGRFPKLCFTEIVSETISIILFFCSPQYIKDTTFGLISKKREQNQKGYNISGFSRDMVAIQSLCSVSGSRSARREYCYIGENLGHVVLSQTKTTYRHLIIMSYKYFWQ